MTHARDDGGRILDVGRRSRVVPAAIRRALDYRDGGCRFPGCDNRFCDAHHIVHWADGGDTCLNNLVNLCRFHHRAVHEGGFRVRVASDGAIQFFRPDGRPLPDAPEPPRLGEAERSVAALRAVHAGLGLAIDASTPTPHWHGERLDLHYAIYALRSAQGDDEALG